MTATITDMPEPRVRLLQRVTVVAALVAIAVTASMLVVAPTWGGSRSRAEQRLLSAQRARAAAHDAAARTLARAARSTPRTTHATCARTARVPGQGASCRMADGMYVLPQAGDAPVLSHGPDLVQAADAAAALAGRAGRSAVIGSRANIICSAPERTRHVALLYLLPSDYATGGAWVHGDRYDQVVPQLRQALYDAAAMVDTRAGQLAPGTRRRMRVRCDPDGQPTVQRVVLPRTAAQYRSARAGFGQMYADLQKTGDAEVYRDFARRHLPSERRLLGYYDADFLEGYAGQGTLYRRASLLTRGGFSPSDPLLSRTVRNINNNPPIASFAVQYGTRVGEGEPDPPLPNDLLHELSHTMGAVQDEPPTSSGAGHCVDGLDIMCYDDGGPFGARYSAAPCPDPVAPEAAEDEQFDCNGDTYFHPAPPASDPLARATTWQLGLPANETLSADTAGVPEPAPVAAAVSGGAGTNIAIAWSPVAPVRGRSYEVRSRVDGGPWLLVGSTTSRRLRATTLLPNRSYEFAVSAIDANGDRGLAALTSRATGSDTTPPSRVEGVARLAAGRSTISLRWLRARDNVRVSGYRIERRSGARWVRAASAAGGGVPGSATSVTIGRLARGTTYDLRVVAVDARSNAALPSRTVRVATAR